VEGSVREVYTGSEDILLSGITAGIRARVIGRIFCTKRSERKQGYEIAKRKYRF